jgi:hypothetical protein
MYKFVQLIQALAYEVHELMKVINCTYLLIPQTNNDAQGWCMLRHFPAVIIENIYVRGQEPDLGGGGASVNNVGRQISHWYPLRFWSQHATANNKNKKITNKTSFHLHPSFPVVLCLEYEVYFEMILLLLVSSTFVFCQTMADHPRYTVYK